MSTTIEIRNVPDELHSRLVARAATAGMSLSDYLLAEIRRAGGAADASRSARAPGAPRCGHTRYPARRGGALRARPIMIIAATATAVAVPLLTCDRRLAAAPGYHARIELVQA